MSKMHGGKGDAPRPLSVPMEKFDENFEAIFGKKTKLPQPEIKEMDVSYHKNGVITNTKVEKND